jgi:hypothetical protein
LKPALAKSLQHPSQPIADVWHAPVIPVMAGSQFQLGWAKSKTYVQNKQSKRTGGMARAVEHLKGLSSKTSTIKTKPKQQQQTNNNKTNKVI